MPWSILLWVLAFVMQAGLLGANMWGLVVLSDLEVGKNERGTAGQTRRRREGKRARGLTRAPLTSTLPHFPRPT